MFLVLLTIVSENTPPLYHPPPAAHFITLPPVVPSCLLGLKVQTTQNLTQPCNTHYVCTVYVVCSSCKCTLNYVAVSITDCGEGAKCYTACVLLMRVWRVTLAAGLVVALVVFHLHGCRVWHTRNRLMFTSTSFIDNTDNVMLLQHWFHLPRSHLVWVEF